MVWCLFSGMFLINHLLNRSTPDSFPGQGNLTNLVVIPDRQQNKTNKNILSSSQTYFFGIKQSVNSSTITPAQDPWCNLFSQAPVEPSKTCKPLKGQREGKTCFCILMHLTVLCTVLLIIGKRHKTPRLHWPSG